MRAITTGNDNLGKALLEGSAKNDDTTGRNKKASADLI